MFRTLLLFLCTYHLFAFNQVKTIDLKNWYFIDAKRSMNINGMYPATVPGVVHQNLMSMNGQDFYAEDFEHSTFAKWIENTDWIYETKFEISEEQLSKNQELIFEGLDTYADIYLNDSLILKADNMFRTWVIQVKDILKIGTNNLSIYFTSPLNYNREKVQNAKYELPSGNETVDLKVSAYTRKAAYQFGWDFGPRFVTCGIWRPCYLRTWENFRMDNFHATTKSINGKNALMNFHFTLNSTKKYDEKLEFEFMGKFFEIYLDSGKNEIQFYHEVKDAKFWYPNGHGEQPIYSSTFKLYRERKEVLFTESVNYAVRTIELINEPDSIGTSFYFKVNGKPIFIKGANYVPQDLFLPRVTDKQTERLLAQVKAANMNMIRVWGGGIYESDLFYNLCDLYGIMVWQDFMFANSMYPSDSTFHHNIEREVEDNVIRLRNHPCIALWCGNNEIEVAWKNWGWQKQFGYSQKDSTEIWENYLSIFHDLIPAKLKELDSSRAYIPSSPQSNWGTKENFKHGAMHYWGVWHGKEELDSFKTNVGRFMVEYGFQSYPLEDWLKSTIANHINPDDKIFKDRQKSYIGDALIKKEIQNYFGDVVLFSDWLLASQFIQSQALEKAIQSHRLAAPHCMGTLFWQLNDCWPGASWSVIDYYGNEKVGYEEIKKQFSPIIAIVDTTDNELSVSVQSEIPFEGSLILNPYSSQEDLHVLNPTFQNQNVYLKTMVFKFKIDAMKSTKVVSFKLNKYFNKYPADLTDLQISISNGNEIIFEDHFHFRKLSIDEIY